MEAKIPSEVQPRLVTKAQPSVKRQAEKVTDTKINMPSVFGQIFQDLHFPVSKIQIIKYLHFNSNGELLSKIQNIEEKQYSNESEIARAAGIIP